MTLNEIYKIIDESVIVQEEKIDGINELWLIEEAQEKISFKSNLKQLIAKGSVLHFYTISKVSSELVYYAKVDHIDPEKKIVRKKLDEMTKEEIEKVRRKFCDSLDNCYNCPFAYHVSCGVNVCLDNFLTWKKRYKETKDKEFEVEVEA